MLPPDLDAGIASPALPIWMPGRYGHGANATMTLTTRLALAMSLLGAVAVSAVGWLSYRGLEQAVLPRVLDRIETHSRLVAADLESYVSGVRGDISIFRSTPVLSGLIRARQAGGVDPVDGVAEKTWQRRIEALFSSELEAKPAYSELRIIGMDDLALAVVDPDDTEF